MATGGVGDPTSDFRVQELSEAQMARAVEVAHRAGKRVMAHAEGTEGIKAAARAGVDSVEHGTCLDEEGTRLLARRGTWLVPTLLRSSDGRLSRPPSARTPPAWPDRRRSSVQQSGSSERR